jgi:hypothetical protein
MVKLIKASCDSSYPLCVHYGFLINDVVVHNTPAITNNFGGNIVTQKLEAFKNDREIYEIVDLDLDQKVVWDYAEKNKTKKFNYVSFNCEQFANDVISGNKKSSILARSLILLGIGLFIWKKSKKNQK